MAGKYVKCVTRFGMTLCVNAQCICSNFLNAMIETYPEDKIKACSELIDVNCAVYAFNEKGFIKYGKEIRKITEDEMKKFRVLQV